MLCKFLLRPFPNTHGITRGAGIGGSNKWTPGESPLAFQEVHQTQEAHQCFTCTVPQRLTGTAVFTDEPVNGEEKNVLRQPRSWRPRKVQCLRVTSQMRPGKRFTLKAYSKAVLRRQNLTSVGELDVPHNRADYRDMSRCPTVLFAHGS